MAEKKVTWTLVNQERSKRNADGLKSAIKAEGLRCKIVPGFAVIFGRRVRVYKVYEGK